MQRNTFENTNSNPSSLHFYHDCSEPDEAVAQLDLTLPEGNYQMFSECSPAPRTTRTYQSCTKT